MAKRITSLIFAIFIISVFVYTLVSPKTEVLDLENRNASPFPSFSIESFKNKEFSNKLDSYLLDQFPLREKSILSYQALHQRKEGNYTLIEGNKGYEYVVLENGMIISCLTTPKNMDNAYIWSNRINEISSLCKEKDLDLFFAIVPSKAESLDFLLPEELSSNLDKPVYDEIFKNLDDEVNVISMFDDFSKISNYELENMYFKTDPHWNFKGSYMGFTFLCNHLKDYGFNTDISKFNYHSEDASYIGCFYGQYNKALGKKYPSDEEYIKYVPDNDAYDSLKLYMLEDGIEKETSLDTVIETSKDGSTASYTSLTCLQKDYLHFSNEAALNDYKLVVLKDSFFSGIVLDMTLLFKDIYVIDGRYYKDLVLEDVLSLEDFDGMLLFYNSTACEKVDENSVDNLITNYKVRND